MSDQIRYDLLTQQALRGVVRNVLTDVAKNDRLPGDHHFYISFDTRADGVRLSDRLRAQYPEEMTIILQHQFWDLDVDDEAFRVGLSFGGVPEKLTVPFAAINEFVDPSVQFGLRFEEIGEDDTADETGTRGQAPAAKTKRLPPAAATPAPATSVPSVASAPPPAAVPAPAATAEPAADQTATGAEVVRLDRFRKK